jgi:proteasome lid subunit RPN8/RPN11
MMPIDFNVIGTVHSHPSNSFYPSKADSYLFQKHGKIHLIVAHPYNMDSFRAYDKIGKTINLEII